MKNELEFLQHIKSELSSVEYGEGISHNLHILNIDISERLEELLNQKNHECEFVDVDNFSDRMKCKHCNKKI